MSSGFVPAGTDSRPKTDSDEWARAKLQVETSRKTKPPEEGTQEGGKSLYEHLQAQKAAKQEAFEEATKLRNQFRPLDDSEIEFLDSVQQRERAQEAAVRKETNEQLEAFRREAREASSREDKETDKETPSGNVTWNTSKKRRRENPGNEIGDIKMRRISAGHHTQPKPKPPENVTTAVPRQGSNDNDSKTHKHPIDTNLAPESTSNASKPVAGLGLDAYSSDDEED